MPWLSFFFFSVLLSFLFTNKFSKVDRTLRFDMTLLTVFEACEVVVVLNLLGGFREFSVFWTWEIFQIFLKSN